MLDLDHPPLNDGMFDGAHDAPSVAPGWLVANAGSELLGSLGFSRDHRCEQLLLGSASCLAKGRVSRARESHEHGERFGGVEVEGRTGPRAIKGVAPAAASLRPDRDAGLLQSEDVALDGARRDLQARSQHVPADRTGRSRTQFLDKRIETVRSAQRGFPSSPIHHRDLCRHHRVDIFSRNPLVLPRKSRQNGVDAAVELAKLLSESGLADVTVHFEPDASAIVISGPAADGLVSAIDRRPPPHA
jgi:hypothetical protein